MPIYLCKPSSGWNAEDPSHHGVPVYAHPFCLQDAEPVEQYHRHAGVLNNRNTSVVSRSGEVTDRVDRTAMEYGIRENPSPPRGDNADGDNGNNDVEEREGYNMGRGVRRGPFAQFALPPRNGYHVQYDEMGRAAHQQQLHPGGVIGDGYDATYDQMTDTGSRTDHTQREGTREGVTLLPIIRKVRYAEVVLVDAVFWLYGCYWLRLKWPGTRGGAAGYIALPADVPPEDEMGLQNFDRCMPTTEDRDLGDGETEEDGQVVGEETDDERRMEDAVTHHNEDARQLSERSPPEDGDLNVVEDDCLLLEQQITEGSDGASATTGQSQSVNSNNDGENSNIVSQEVVSVYPPRPRCETTGYFYPTSHEVELLATYDDGLAALMASSDADSLEGDSGGGEKVICRICRDGLHDIDYDWNLQEGEAAVLTGDATDNAVNGGGGGGGGDGGADDNLGINRPVVNDLVALVINPGHFPARGTPPRQRRPNTYAPDSLNTTTITNRQHPYSQNPLLSPCDCSGSMAFVHLFCIEQWRCRSRHPAAKSGSHCETCRTPYALPPRPPPPMQFHRDLRGGAGGEQDDHNELLEGMPPHVLHALRNPHLGWRIGSNLVSRKCLRPFAPILISPAVALYCRARRALKKRGVSRRRWACSLCRRRARWKCVRCLRSYYCSRQCQNVSWHIVHKHVCYKPARFCWSMVVYGGLMLWFVPGISEYPLLYDLGLSFLWLSFGCMGILGGGIATALKRGLGLDIRGRTLEGVVVGLTVAFAAMLWRLIWGFFGVGEEQCWGVVEQMGLGYSSPVVTDLPQSMSRSLLQHFHRVPEETIHQEDIKLGHILTAVQNFILHPGKLLVRLMDKSLLKLDIRFIRWLCADGHSEPFCLDIARDANPDFIAPSHDGQSRCGSDMHLAASVFLLAGFFLAFGFVWRRREWVLGGGRELRMRGGGRRRRLGRRDNAAGAMVVEEEVGERADVGGRRRHAHQE